MLVIQDRKVHERKEPWNLGLLEASPWIPVNGSREYFARSRGDSCGKYVPDAARKMYFTSWEYPRYFPTYLQALRDVPQMYMKFAGHTRPTN